MTVAARWNGYLAAELDPVRHAERRGELRLAAAVALAPSLVACEALLAGVTVQAARLEPALVRELALTGDVTLDAELALAVAARLPLTACSTPTTRPSAGRPAPRGARHA